MGRRRRKRRALKEASFNEPDVEVDPLCEIDPEHGEAQFMGGDNQFMCPDCFYEYTARELVPRDRPPERENV